MVLALSRQLRFQNLGEIFGEERTEEQKAKWAEIRPKLPE
jgi:hypothetical protein